jgi:hypothetical protein
MTPTKPTALHTDYDHVVALATVVSALRDFLDCVDSTGGVFNDGLSVCPIADPTWTDLGAAYIKACIALGRRPVWGAQQTRPVFGRAPY